MYTTDDIILKQTCSCSPEQYDAFISGQQVGYLRLRFNYFSTSFPEYGGKKVYEAITKGYGDFYNEEEREFHLKNAKNAIIAEIQLLIELRP